MSIEKEVHEKEKSLINANHDTKFCDPSISNLIIGTSPVSSFMRGVAIGSVATLILSNENIRNGIVKGGIRIFYGLMESFEEIKEKFLDLKAEVESENKKSV